MEMMASILVVWDCEQERNAIVHLLLQHFAGARGCDGIGIAKACEVSVPDIFIIGVDHVRGVRRAFPHARIILLSDTSDSSKLASVIEFGIDRCLKISFEDSQLLEAVRSVKANIVHEQESAHERRIMEEYKRAIDASSIISITNSKGVITYANDLFCKISGYSSDELLGQKHSIIRHPEMDAKVFEEMWRTISSKKIWRGVVKNRAKDGSTYIVDSIILPIVGLNGRIKEYIAVRHDLTELVQKNAIIKRQSTDMLTGLVNRVKLIEDIELFEPLALCLINIDGFSNVNDVYGIEFGDQILKLVAKRIVQALPERAYTPYRLDGDEFAILLIEPDVNHEQVFKRAMESINVEPFINQGQVVYLTARMGIAVHEGRDSLSKASLALKHAKERRRGVVVYERHFDLESAYKSNIIWANRLFKAISEQRIVPFFQPILNIKTGVSEKYEALVRMIDEDGNEISPYHFLEIAKKTKQYHHITKIMVHEGIKQAKKHNVEISINLSIDDLENPSTLAYIFDEIKQSGCGEKIIFEITESEGMGNYAKVRDFIAEIRKLGCKIAIDDFGSGYSNFMHILELEIDFLKIDGSIVKNILENVRSHALLCSIVRLAQELGIKCVAEFVSSRELLEGVSEGGVEFAQGFYIGRPSVEIL
ncbi:MAG: putative bifunctional diguanylate cyclase/phosphodiesterase [Wolinella sp.]